jgi:hypothetical protein
MFELSVVSNTPLTPLDDVDDVALQFLTQIGYLPTGYDPKTEATDVKDSVPYKLVLKKAWSFTEANVEMAMDGYRKTVDHLQKLVEEER